jgi:hypothetical protein
MSEEHIITVEIMIQAKCKMLNAKWEYEGIAL